MGSEAIEPRRFLFLDIDGVLNDLKENPAGSCGIRPECARHLNTILDTLPDVQIVVSSSWRYMVHEGAMTSKGLEHVLKIGGVRANERVAGITATDEEIKSRGEQVRTWLSQRPPETVGVALDDVESGFKTSGVSMVQTDPDTGLTAEIAQQVIDALCVVERKVACCPTCGDPLRATGYGDPGMGWCNRCQQPCIDEHADWRKVSAT